MRFECGKATTHIRVGAAVNHDLLEAALAQGEDVTGVWGLGGPPRLGWSRARREARRRRGTGRGRSTQRRVRIRSSRGARAERPWCVPRPPAQSGAELQGRSGRLTRLLVHDARGAAGEGPQQALEYSA